MMTTGWIKVTPAQCVALSDLRLTNTTGDMVTPMPDTNGDFWLSADCLDERTGVFAHYASVLDQLTVTQQQQPVWPSSQ